MSQELPVAIVTGAGKGIGFEIARRLAAAGTRIVLNDLDFETAQQAAERIHQSGGQCTPIAGDSSDLDLISRLVTTAVQQYGQLDIAIANAGISPFGRFLEYTVDDFQRLVTVNLQGTFFLAQRAAAAMIDRRVGGRLLFLSSVTGFQFHPDATAYGMSKAAISMMARNLGVELAAFGITVNAIAPGATLTERTIEDADYETTWSRITPNGRAATTTDIANAALFLVSPESLHITGQTLIVDGGWTATSPRPN